MWRRCRIHVWNHLLVYQTLNFQVHRHFKVDNPPRRFAPCRIDAGGIIGPVVVGNIGDSSASSHRLYAAETQQLPFVADATTICYLRGVVRGQ